MIKCPECKSKKVVKNGLVWRKRQRVQRYQCNNCGKLFTIKRDPPTLRSTPAGPRCNTRLAEGRGRKLK